MTPVSRGSLSKNGHLVRKITPLPGVLRAEWSAAASQPVGAHGVTCTAPTLPPLARRRPTAASVRGCSRCRSRFARRSTCGAACTHRPERRVICWPSSIG